MLFRSKPKWDDKGNTWLLIKERDDYALDEEGISEFSTSVRTKRTMEEIEENK